MTQDQGAALKDTTPTKRESINETEYGPTKISKSCWFMEVKLTRSRCVS